MKSIFFALMLFFVTFFIACNNDAGNTEEISEETKDSITQTTISKEAIKEEAITYASGNVTLKGYFAYDSTNTAKRPIVLVVPEWWGLTDYPRMRAQQLAQMGYLAMAVDIYGNGKTADNPEEAQKSATPFYQNPAEATARLNAALMTAKNHAMADTSKTAAIGYCFGGTVVLNAAKMGINLDGVVSFHGGLEGVQPNKDSLKAKILVLHGGADSFVPEAQVDAFRRSMDSINADYTFRVYPDATHAFTNPDADKKAAQFNMPIKYNAGADSASWNDMKLFLHQIFK